MISCRMRSWWDVDVAWSSCICAWTLSKYSRYRMIMMPCGRLVGCSLVGCPSTWDAFNISQMQQNEQNIIFNAIYVYAYIINIHHSVSYSNAGQLHIHVMCCIVWAGLRTLQRRRHWPAACLPAWPGKKGIH